MHDPRISQLEREVGELRRLIRGLVSRPALSSVTGLGFRLERARLTEKLEIGGTASAMRLTPQGERPITVTDLDGWPIADGKEITVNYYYPPGAEEPIWHPITAQRAPQSLVTQICCDEESEQATVCDILAYLDADRGDSDDCPCSESPGESTLTGDQAGGDVGGELELLGELDVGGGGLV